ncbi:MAG: hypothetical protein WBC21_01325 [Minisyncoccales bacterium]
MIEMIEPKKGMTFSISEIEVKKLDAWLEQHDKSCRFAMLRHESVVKMPDENRPAIMESGLSYSFKPTSIGNVIVVECKCGEECNITDYESW